MNIDQMTRLLRGFPLIESNSPSSNVHPLHRPTNLHLLFLAPLVFTITALVLVFIVLRYQHANDDVQSTIYQLQSKAQNYFEDGVYREIHAMRGIIEVISHREDLSDALAVHDRIALLANSERQFDDLKRHFNITHFYFMDVDRVALLRVHAPLRFGYTINRTTMLQAESSESISSGIELGVLGTLTLRVVAPWFDGQQNLIGYIELGMEIDQLLNRLQESQNVKLITVIDKKYLKRNEWIDGMSNLGRTHDWDKFQNVIINKYSELITPQILVDFFESEGSIKDYEIKEIKYNNHEHRLSALPIIDANGQNIAQIIIASDVTQIESEARNATYTFALTALALGGVLLVFFNWLIGRITQRHKMDEKELRELATHDGLTNLYNQRAFYSMLNDDVDRSCRYDRPVSLLLLDIDHFKNINDTYGHQAGDIVLRDISQRLVKRMRNTDRVCRYGGEEITVILPETTTHAAQDIAEDLRKLIESEPFNTINNLSVTVTVSIGIATFPDHANEVSQLVSGADAALYEAKDNGRNRVCVCQSPK